MRGTEEAAPLQIVLFHASLHRIPSEVVSTKRYQSLLCLLLLPLLALASPRGGNAAAVLSPVMPRYIALTFDDGPSSEATPLLLDGLKERGAHATFFLIGDQIAGAEELVLRMQDEGHQIGNHTFSHVRLDRSSSAGMEELSKTDALLRELLGAGEYWIRPPWGFVSDAVRQSVDVPLIYWAVDTEDWSVLNSGKVARKIVQNVQDGDIVLLHDIYPSSVEAALQAIDELSAQGYQFVTVEELFALNGITPQSGRFYVRPDREVNW